jgi:CRP-like cAMP-binding protein
VSGESHRRNRLFDALPGEVGERLGPHTELHSLKRSTILHKPGEEIRDLYFPIDCAISITVTMRDGRTAETGIVGSREVVGINAFMGGRETTQTEYVVQVPGGAIRVPADPLREEFDRNRDMRSVLLGYTQAMIAQISQNAACNALHSVQPRYARWLLEVRDRIQSDDVELTHEFISEMLGVRRATVTELAGEFERAGMIRHRRGLTRIIDGERLEQIACECYAVLRDEYDRLLSRAQEARSGESI